MDEPFSALDVLTAENLRSELLELWLNRKMPTSSIFLVTHNIEEAVPLADRIVVLGRNPGSVRADFDVDLPRPRDRKTGHFVELVDYIYKTMTQPDVDHPMPMPSFLPGRALRVKYPMLPHVRPGGLAGFVELLKDRGGTEDLYRLAEEFAMDVDDLLPIVEAATMLGFTILREGDVSITAEGRAFAESDILTRKVLFRDSALKRIPLLQQMDSILKAKADHSILVEFFHDVLDEHFSEDEVARQLDTALHWGRYGEILTRTPRAGGFFFRKRARRQPPRPVSRPGPDNEARQVSPLLRFVAVASPSLPRDLALAGPRDVRSGSFSALRNRSGSQNLARTGRAGN